MLCVEESGGHFGLESQRVHKLATGYAFLINAASSAGLVERPATGDPALSPT